MIKAKAIIEIAGSPKEHVEKTLELVVKEINAVKERKLLKKEIFPAEEKDELFSSIAEVDIEFKDLEAMYSFCFDFMPSSLEIISPVELSIPSTDVTNGLNDLLATLHQLDRKLKETNAKIKILQINTNRVFANLVSFLAEKPISLEEISKKTGVGAKELLPFLEIMEKEKRIKKENDHYVKHA